MEYACGFCRFANFYFKKNILPISKFFYLPVILSLILFLGWAYKAGKSPFSIYQDAWSGQNSIVDKYGILTLQLIDYFSDKKKI